MNSDVYIHIHIITRLVESAYQPMKKAVVTVLSYLTLAGLLLLSRSVRCQKDPDPNQDPDKDPEPDQDSDPGPLPQYYINYGLCDADKQNQEYGRWVLTRPLSKQLDDALVLFLDTKNLFPMSPSYGTVVPPEFPIREMTLAYFDNAGVKAWSPQLDSKPYKETSPFYGVNVNGVKINTVRDLKDTSRGAPPDAAMYSLKATLNGVLKPSAFMYNITIVKACRKDTPCDTIPHPASVFVNELGHLAYTFWFVGQPLTVDGVFYKDHGWCPVQTGFTVP